MSRKRVRLVEHPYNIMVELRPNESQEKLLKRFLKKCKKQRILEEYKEKTDYHRTKSQKLRQKRLKNKFRREKLEKY